MSSGFVSSGTNDNPIKRDEEWKRAQEELEQARRAKAEVGKQADGRSLYEVLQQNKAAKQDAFEESIRLKNQFRSLDEDEAEFLDTILESTRAKETAIRAETATQVALFRQQQEEALKPSDPTETSVSADNEGSNSLVAEDTSWAVSGKKRKRERDKQILKGVKMKRSSSHGIDREPDSGPDEPKTAQEQSSVLISQDVEEASVQAEDAANPLKVSSTPKGLGLGAYDSDSDG